MRLLGAGQMLIGAITVVTPESTRRLAGLEWARMTGPGFLGWRLFGLRQLLLGAGVASGVEPVRSANWILQPADLVVFARAYRSGSIPRDTAFMLIGLAGAALSLMCVRRTGSVR